MIEFLKTFDSSMWILQFFDNHWLVVGMAWGAFRIIAKRTKTKVDDEIVALIKGIRDERKQHAGQD